MTLTITEQKLRNLTFNKLIDNPAYRVEDIPKKDLIQLVYNCSNNSIVSHHKHWKIFHFAFKQFYKKYRNRYISLIIVLSFFIAFISKIIASKVIVITAFSMLIFCLFYPFHTIYFAERYLYIEGQTFFLVKKLEKINKKARGFKSNTLRNINRISDKILQEIIEDEISSLDRRRGQKGEIAFISFIFALFLSWGYAYIIGDSLNDWIVWIANNSGFKDFDSIKNLTTQTIVLSLFAIGGLFMAFAIESNIEKRRSILDESLIEIKERSSKSYNPLKNIHNWISNRFFK